MVVRLGQVRLGQVQNILSFLNILDLQFESHVVMVMFLNSILTAGPASTPFVYTQKVKLQLQFYCWQPCIVDQSTSVTSLARKRSRLFELPRRGYEYLFRFLMTNMITSVFSTIHSFCGLSYERSTTASKASLPQSVIQCFLFQFPVSSLFLKVIQQLLTSSSSSSFYLSFSFVQKAVPMQDVTSPVSLPFIYCMQDTPLLLASM